MNTSLLILTSRFLPPYARKLWIFVVILLSVPVAAQTQPPAVTTKPKSWVELRAQTDAARYFSGGPIQLSLLVKNISPQGAVLHFSSSQRFDFQVFRVGKNELLYTWSASKMFLASVGQLSLKPGQSVRFRAELSSEMGELTPGRYRVEARLSNSTAIKAQPFEFEILAPLAQVRAQTDKKIYSLGEPVRVRFSVENLTAKTQTFLFETGQNTDVIIRSESGKPIWNWAANLRFIMVSRPMVFTPQEKKHFEVVWDGRALPDEVMKPGKYQIQAIYTSKPPLLSRPVAIEIR